MVPGCYGPQIRTLKSGTPANATLLELLMRHIINLVRIEEIDEQIDKEDEKRKAQFLASSKVLTQPSHYPNGPNLFVQSNTCRI